MLIGYFLSACSLAGNPSFERTSVLNKKNVEERLCTHFSRWKQSGVSEDALRQGLTFFRDHISEFENTKAFAIADYQISSDKKRFFVFEWETGRMYKEHVSHGSGSQKNKKWGDPNHDGMLDTCDHNLNQSNMTRVGIFKVLDYYLSSTHGPKKWPDLNISGERTRINGLRLKGLSSTNKESLKRGVVMHEATYNTNSIMGRSFGCPAFRPNRGSVIMPYFAKGGMFYAYAPQCRKQYQKVREEIQNWEDTCASF